MIVYLLVRNSRKCNNNNNLFKQGVHFTIRIICSSMEPSQLSYNMNTEILMSLVKLSKKYS